MNTKFDFKIATDQYEVIGSGPMITTPQQVGDWWVSPAHQYTGTIPVDIQQKMFQFLSSGVKIEGLLIAEDMREVEEKHRSIPSAVIPSERRPTMPARNTSTDISSLLIPLGGILATLAALFVAALEFDPMLIAVLSDGRWICLGTWYD